MGTLRIIKLVHTIVWAVFAGCVIAVPWLARHNKTIFGTLYVVGLIALAWAWFGRAFESVSSGRDFL